MEKRLDWKQQQAAIAQQFNRYVFLYFMYIIYICFVNNIKYKIQ